MNRHQRIDERSLAFGRAIAEQLHQHPELIATARSTLLRWMQTASPRSMSTLNEWLSVLDAGAKQVVEVLTSPDERATRLRQSNPFAGVLPEQQRIAIIREYAE